MTAAVESTFFSGIYQGRIVHTRFWLYMGFIAGASLLAFFGGSGYDEDAYIFRLLSMQGVIWGGVGALLGAAASMLLGDGRSSAVTSSVPWFDGLILMLLLMGAFTLLEPHAALISYEDQSNLLSGRIVMAMNLLFIFSAVCYIMYLFAPESFIGKMATMTAWGGVYAGVHPCCSGGMSLTFCLMAISATHRYPIFTKFLFCFSALPAVFIWHLNVVIKPKP